MTPARPALFLDRDGTLIVDVGYPKDPERVELLPGAAAALREARAAGYALVIVSNQSGVARGLVSTDEAARVQARVEERFGAEGVRFDGAYFCFHGPDDGCACRKPAPGLLLRAGEDLGLELSASVMVGDKPSDVQAGRSAGCAHAISFSSWEEVSGWMRERGVLKGP